MYKFITGLVAIGGIVVLEAIALFQGINGVALSLSIGAIGAIGGATGMFKYMQTKL